MTNKQRAKIRKLASKNLNKKDWIETMMPKIIIWIEKEEKESKGGVYDNKKRR